MQRELPMQMRQAAFQPATLNEADRTVELVWTTGAPLLNSHSASDLVDVIGVVERAWLEGNEGRAVVRIDAGEIDVLRKVKDGILRNVSVGYAVRKYQIEEGDIPVYRAIDWEPMELSLVPIGADAGAGN